MPTRHIPASSLSSRRSATCLSFFFIVLALCSIALIVGSEMFLKFRNSTPEPESFVLSRVAPSGNFSSYKEEYPLFALMSSIANLCDSSSSPIMMTSPSSVTSISDVLNFAIAEGNYWTEMSQQLTFNQVKEKLFVDGGVILSSSKTTTVSNDHDDDDASDYVLIVGFNASGALAIDPSLASNSSFYRFMPYGSGGGRAANSSSVDENSRIVVENGLSLTCPGYRDSKKQFKRADEQAHSVYTWVDKHALSRPKRNISRDFADAVCVAEILKFYFPSFVDLHNYVPAFSQKQKIENWLTMKQKVFRRLNLDVDPKDLTDIAGAVPGAIEKFLLILMEKIPIVQQKIANNPNHSSHHQNNSASRRSGSKRGGSSSGGGGMRSASTDSNTNNAAGSRPGTARRSASATQQQNEFLSNSQNNIHVASDAAKDHEISHLRDSVRLLTAKIKQMEELLKLRDSKVRDLQERIVDLTS